MTPQFTELAQLVEHRSPKPGVGSSSLSFRANNKRKMKIVNYIRESYSELAYKVSWPTKQELANSAVVVLLASVIIALIVMVIDFGFEGLMKLIYSIL